MDVTIENQSERTHTWSFDTNSPGGFSRSNIRGTSVLSYHSMTVGGRSKRTFRVLAPLRGGVGPYYGVSLNAMLTCLSASGQMGVDFAARPDDHAFSAKGERHIVANTVRACDEHRILIGARFDERLPFVDVVFFPASERAEQFRAV